MVLIVIFLSKLRYRDFFKMWLSVTNFSQVSVSYTAASFFSFTTAINFRPFSSVLPSSAHFHPLWFPFGNHYAELPLTFFFFPIWWYEWACFTKDKVLYSIFIMHFGVFWFSCNYRLSYFDMDLIQLLSTLLVCIHSILKTTFYSDKLAIFFPSFFY